MTPAYRPNRPAYYLYESALLFFVLVCLIQLVHLLSAKRADVTVTLPDGRVKLALPAGSGAQAGDLYPIYRFHQGFKDKIGDVRIDSVEGASAVGTPQGLRFPVGRNAAVASRDGDTIELSAGRDILQQGQSLNIYRRREFLGIAVVANAWADRSTARIFKENVRIQPGDYASEFSVPTQILLEKKPGLDPLDIGLFLAGVVAYAFLTFRNREPVFALIGSWWQKAKPKIITPPVMTGLEWIIGLSMSRWMVLFAFKFLGFAFSAWWRVDPLASLGQFLVDKSDWIWGGAAVVFSAACLRIKASPLDLIRRAFTHRQTLKKIKPGPLQNAVIWLCHLVVAYAFAHALLTIIGGNLNLTLGLAWPDVTARVRGEITFAGLEPNLQFLSSLGEVLRQMAAHPPRVANGEAALGAVNYLLFSVTIVACLVGYGHSVFGFLWGKKLNNVDFTLPGWLVNSWCYGPMLGWMVWYSVPSLTGRDPVFEAGFLPALVSFAAVWMNLIYTLTILNLGTMFGVMTDKGVRRSWFYSVVRHPSYTVEVFIFVFIDIKGFAGPLEWIAASVYFILYYFRSEREDHFMSISNPDYLEYKKEVPWKYIPYVY